MSKLILQLNGTPKNHEYHLCDNPEEAVWRELLIFAEPFVLKKYWDGVSEPGFTAKSCSTAALRLFKQKATESGRMDRAVLRDTREVILENLELTESRGLKRAACLLFSDKPERIVSGTWIKIGFFVTDDDLRYQDEIHGNLFEQVEKTLEILHTKYLKAYISYKRIQRIEKFLFPEGALREALLNAVVHKDYSSGIPIQISVYDDKIVLWNPGHLPEGWSMQRFLGKHPSKPPNPLLANAFFRAGYIESWGRGIEKIRRECREYDIPPPVYDFEMSGLMLTFHANPQHLVAALGEQETDRKLGGESQKTRVKTTQETTQEKIIVIMRNKPSITRKELAKQIGISTDGIKYHLEKMKASGRIRHIGPTKAGHWEVLK